MQNAMHAGYTIVPFRAEHGAAFHTLNRAWLDAHGLYEPADEEDLSNPQGIANDGGAVFVALRDEEVVGTVAVGVHGDGEMELIKLTVAESSRGAGLGRALTEHAIAFARSCGAAKLILLSSSKLTSALRLYLAMGFVHRPLPADQPYVTADVYMELDL